VVLHQDSLTHSYPTDTEKLELPMGMVGRQLTMKLLDYILPLELHRAQELAVPVPQSFTAIFVPQVHPVERQLETKQLAYTQLQEAQLVLELEQRVLMSSRFFTELLFLLEHLAKQQSEITLHQELLLVLVLPQLEILQLDFIQHQELQPAMEQAVQVIQLSRAISVQQVPLAAQLLEMKRLVCTPHQELLAALGPELKAPMSSRFSLELPYLKQRQHRQQLDYM
jgi:hypothetical protein